MQCYSIFSDKIKSQSNSLSCNVNKPISTLCPAHPLLNIHHVHAILSKKNRHIHMEKDKKQYFQYLFQVFSMSFTRPITVQLFVHIRYLSLKGYQFAQFSAYLRLHLVSALSDLITNRFQCDTKMKFLNQYFLGMHVKFHPCQDSIIYKKPK